VPKFWKLKGEIGAAEDVMSRTGQQKMKNSWSDQEILRSWRGTDKNFSWRKTKKLDQTTKKPGCLMGSGPSGWM
jgi:hypothetical protein